MVGSFLVSSLEFFCGEHPEIRKEAQPILRHSFFACGGCFFLATQRRMFFFLRSHWASCRMLMACCAARKGKPKNSRKGYQAFQQIPSNTFQCIKLGVAQKQAQRDLLLAFLVACSSHLKLSVDNKLGGLAGESQRSRLSCIR